MRNSSEVAQFVAQPAWNCATAPLGTNFLSTSRRKAHGASRITVTLVLTGWEPPDGGGTEAMRSKTPRGAGRAAFLAHLDGIRASLERGQTVKAVHQLYAEKTGLSYAHFTRLVKTLARPKEARRETPSLPPVAAPDPPVAEVPARSPVKKPGARLPEFQFDPLDAYRKKYV